MMPKRASFKHANGAAQPFGQRQHRVCWETAIVKDQFARDRRAQRNFFVDVRRCEARARRRERRNRGFPSSVFAHTMATSAIEPFVIHSFVPLSIQSLPSRRANVRIPTGLLPKSGSVRPKHPIASPSRHLAEATRVSDPRCPNDGSRTSRATLAPTRSCARRVSGFEFHARDAVGHRTRAGATVAVQMHAEQPERPQFSAELARQMSCFEPLCDVRKNTVAHERTNRIADQTLFVAQKCVDAEEIDGVRACGARE